MKRKPLSVIIISILMLCGCSAKSKAPQSVQINRDFSCPICVEQAGKSYTAELTLTPDSCKAVFLLPEELKGMNVMLSGGKLIYSLGDLSFSGSPQKSQAQFLELLCSALNDTAATAVDENGVIRVEGSLKEGDYIINLNKKTLRPTFFEMDSADLTVRFG